MVKTLKSYLFRSTKTTGNIVCAALLLFFNFIPQMITYYMLKMMADDIGSFDKVNIFTEFLKQFELITLFVLIFTVIFFSNDEKNGFIKNIVPLQRKRFEIFISRAIYILIYLIAAVLFSLVIFSISYKMFFGSTVYFSISSADLRQFGINLLLSFAVLIMVSMLTVLSRGNALPLTIGILYSLNFFSLFTGIINFLINKLPGVKDFDSSCLLLMTYFSGDYGTMLQKILVPVGYIVISTVLGALILEKRDIR